MQKLDKKNDKTKWMDSNELERQQLDEYDVFIDKRKFVGCKIPRDFRLIRVHTILDVKVDGCHKNRVIANGHLTATPSEFVYLGAVSLRGLCTCVLIGELYGMVPWATDIGIAYLEAVTSEKVCIRACHALY